MPKIGVATLWWHQVPSHKQGTLCNKELDEISNNKLR